MAQWMDLIRTMYSFVNPPLLLEKAAAILLVLMTLWLLNWYYYNVANGFLLVLYV